jgi:hypothetical protein
LDYDSVDPAEAKPTKSAMRLKDLLETITDSYRPLISFSQRLRFLIDIQIAILDQYHDRLHSSVEAFKVLSSSIARAVQGTSKEEVASLSGLGGLERLCRVYGSAIFMENCMRDWGEDIFFLELWEDLQTRAAKNSGNPGKEIAGDMNIRDVANLTSAAVVSGDDDGALFDETAGSYRGLRKRTEDMIAELVINTLKNELKPYTKMYVSLPTRLALTIRKHILTFDHVEPSGAPPPTHPPLPSPQKWSPPSPPCNLISLSYTAPSLPLPTGASSAPSPPL